MSHTTANMATRIQEGVDPLSLILQGENVYTVNAIVRALSLNDYERLTADYNNLYRDYQILLDAIDEFGLMVVTDDSGKVTLSIKDGDSKQ